MTAAALKPGDKVFVAGVWNPPSGFTIASVLPPLAYPGYVRVAFIDMLSVMDIPESRQFSLWDNKPILA